MDRNTTLSSGMIEPASRSVHGIKLRAFSYGSIQLAYMLDLTLFTADEDGPEISDAETQRQIVTFAWIQSAPQSEVVEAVVNKRSAEAVLKFALEVPFEAIPELLSEINRIGTLIRASNVRVESKNPATSEDAPGKS